MGLSGGRGSGAQPQRACKAREAGPLDEQAGLLLAAAMPLSRFAIRLVEVLEVQPLAIARSLQEQVGSSALKTTTDARLQVAVNIGTALFDGHPDHQVLLQQAERVLRSGS